MAGSVGSNLPSSSLYAVSAVRVGLGTAASILIPFQTHSAWLAALACLTIAIILDLGDGTLPQRLGKASPLASFVDHAADSIIHLAVFVGMLAAGLVSVWQVLIIIAAEIMVPYIRNVSQLRTTSLVIRWTERFRTLIYAAGQLLVIAAIVGLLPTWGNHEALRWAMVAAGLIYWLDTFQVLVRNSRVGL